MKLKTGLNLLSRSIKALKRINKPKEEKSLTFWEHLEELRSVFIRTLIVLIVMMIAVFAFKTPVFNFVLAPCNNDFFLYRGLSKLLIWMHLDPLPVFNLRLVNIEVASQFFVHLRVSAMIALVISAPIILFMLWSFVAPALYEKEKNAVKGAFGFASVLFYLGVAFGYCFIFPLTIRFLGSYQVSEIVPNTISLSSYISMFIALILIMGLVFEMPVLVKILNKLHLLPKSLLKKYRRHAFVGLLILAAVITPTGDLFTLSVVTFPLYFLYEFSIAICKYDSPPDEDLF